MDRDGRRGTTKAFLREGKTPGATKVVVCLGDSITEGVGSADWVAKLRHQVGAQGIQFVNAGVAGDLSWNVLQRLDAVIECDPDIVILLVGTNDVAAASFSAFTLFLLRMKGIRQAPTLEWYVENVSEILQRLQSETRAEIAVLEIPMTGEDLGSAINQRIGKYNEALRDVAVERGVACLQLYERLAKLFPPGHIPLPYNAEMWPVVKAQFQRQVLRSSWEDIAARNGLVFHVDHTHLGERAAEVVAQLVAEFVAKR
jgi:acyl-CoA thioesterase-1